MAAHVFNENGQMHEVEIPDIFDVLEGGEDEGAVKFLLGFAGDDESEQVRVFAVLQGARANSRVFRSRPF